uniref:Elongation of very long chain fatty acids protein n=1 Tax=Glossina brevipalpis TaxID=37001 RepID=A0A1A9W1I4_9MUSC
MLIFKVLYEKLIELDTKSDPRTAHLSLEASLKYTFALIALYLFVALKLGPAFMSNRKAFEIKRIIQIYNLTQIVVWTIYLYHPKFNWSCFNTDKADYTMSMLNLGVLGYWMRFFDFADTQPPQPKQPFYNPVHYAFKPLQN